MITKFKLFEKLGVDKIVSDVSERIFEDFLKNYNKDKNFKDLTDTIYVDISDIDVKILKKIKININYNNSNSSMNSKYGGGEKSIIINIGTIDLEDYTKIKNHASLKEIIYHETQHFIHYLREKGTLGKVRYSFDFNEKSLSLIKEKVFNEILKNYNEKVSKDAKSYFINEKPIVLHKKLDEYSFQFYVDFSEFKINEVKEIRIKIIFRNIENYRDSKQCFFTDDAIVIRLFNEDTDIKSLRETLDYLVYEFLRKKTKTKTMFKELEKKESFLFDSRYALRHMFDAFRDKNNNIFGKKISIENFLKYDVLSIQFKLIIIYIYLADENEISSVVQEFYLKAKDSDNMKNYMENMENHRKYKLYKDMTTFKINMDDFETNTDKKNMEDVFLGEQSEIYRLNLLFNNGDKNRDKYMNKYMNKLEKYINMKGKKFIRKIHKLSYFSDKDTDL